MIDAIINAIAEKKEVSVDTISADTTLEGLGLDSLDMIDLMFDVETALGVRLPQDLKGPDYADVATVQDLAMFISRAASPQP